MSIDWAPTTFGETFVMRAPDGTETTLVRADAAFLVIDRIEAELGKRSAELAAARAARSRLRSVLAAVAHRLSEPYTDEPSLTPWDRYIVPAMAALDAALDGTHPDVSAPGRSGKEKP